VLQILINLLGNAVKHTPANGEISVSCLRVPTGIAFAIRDTGPGIPEDKHEEIFKPFMQVEDAFVGNRQGTGLGLAISRELARAMNGDVTVESRVGAGSTFTLRLPVAP
jgi:signal transduction histidine kinase